jgi:hypothetical protein
MTSRRDVLRSMGVGAAAVAAVASSAAAATVAPSLDAFSRGGSSSVSPWWILSPLTVGSGVGKGWSVAALSGVSDGAAVLTLANRDGRQVDIHICARSGRGSGIAQTALFDLVTMDGRDGADATPEDLGRVVMSLAQRIRRNELALGGDLQPFAHLMSHADRVAVFGPERLLFGESVG